tara:strand:- start:318 stop:890 length:573 start_codon:yes stop_codon:yes gene_type:complete
MIVGIDVDGVLRDFCCGLEKVVKENYPQYLPEDYTGINNWKLSDNFTVDKPEIQKIYWDEYSKEIMGESPAFEENVKQMKDMIEWGKDVGITFVCVTSQKPHARHHTLSWLGRHELNFDTIYFRRGVDKPNTPVDFLVDDSPNNYNYWKERRGMEDGFILMDRPYNQHIETKSRIFELDDIVEIISKDTK